MESAARRVGRMLSRRGVADATSNATAASQAPVGMVQHSARARVVQLLYCTQGVPASSAGNRHIAAGCDRTGFRGNPRSFYSAAVGSERRARPRSPHGLRRCKISEAAVPARILM
eukprot:7719357-Pyramimonas_sp.AAC.1